MSKNFLFDQINRKISRNLARAIFVSNFLGLAREKNFGHEQIGNTTKNKRVRDKNYRTVAFSNLF
jgi:hypothetical protein